MSAYTNCNLALQKEPEQDKKNESKIFEIGHIFKTLLREKKILFRSFHHSDERPCIPYGFFL